MRINQALMTEENDNIQQEQSSEGAQSGVRLFPGDILRAAREAKGLSTADVAVSLCLRQQLIEELEENKFDPKVAVTFTRGYLRSYAKHVEASEDDVLAAYHDLIEEKPQPKDMRSFSRKKSMEVHDSRLMLTTYIIVAILVASVVLFFWQQSTSTTDDNGIESTPQSEPQKETDAAQVDQVEGADTFKVSAREQQPLPSSAFIDERPVETESQSAELNADTTNGATENEVAPEPEPLDVAPEGEAVPTEGSVEGPTVSTQPVPAEEVPDVIADEVPESTSVNRTGEYLDVADPSAGELVLYFAGDSWVEVREYGNNENVLAVGTKRKGYNMPLGGVSVYNVILGAPTAVEVYYQGERVDLSALPRNRVVPFRVPEL